MQNIYLFAAETRASREALAARRASHAQAGCSAKRSHSSMATHSGSPKPSGPQSPSKQKTQQSQHGRAQPSSCSDELVSATVETHEFIGPQPAATCEEATPDAAPAAPDGQPASHAAACASPAHGSVPPTLCIAENHSKGGPEGSSSHVTDTGRLPPDVNNHPGDQAAGQDPLTASAAEPSWAQDHNARSAAQSVHSQPSTAAVSPSLPSECRNKPNGPLAQATATPLLPGRVSHAAQEGRLISAENGSSQVESHSQDQSIQGEGLQEQPEKMPLVTPRRPVTRGQLAALRRRELQPDGDMSGATVPNRMLLARLHEVIAGSNGTVVAGTYGNGSLVFLPRDRTSFLRM